MTQETLIPWADDLEAACGGRLEIIHHAAGSLLEAKDAYDGVLSGIADMVELCPEETPGRFPLAGILALPFLFTDTEVAGTVGHEVLEKYCFDTEMKDLKFNITLALHPAQLHSNIEVKTLEDFQGLKLRAPGKIESMVAEEFGAVAVEITTGDLFAALDTGLIDATYFTYSGALAFGVIDVARYLTLCNAFMGVFDIVMNKQVYENLPDDIKKIVDDFSTPEVSRKYAKRHKDAEEGYVRATDTGRTRRGYDPPYILPTEERERWIAAAQPVVDAWIAEMDEKGLPGQEMLDDLKAWNLKYMAELQ